MNKQTQKNLKPNRPELDDEYLDYVDELERKWRASLPRYTDKEWFEIFPEAKAMIPIKIAEWKEVREKLVRVIREGLKIANEKENDEVSRHFCRELVKWIFGGRQLVKVDSHLSRLYRQLAIIRPHKKLSGQFITPEFIQQAKAIPIETVVNQSVSLRTCGRMLRGLCPLHEEKSPSFFIYPESNSYRCYGCNQWGDVIQLVRLLYGYSFKEAVEFLLKGDSHE